MRTSDRGVAALAAHEGIVPAPYLDSVGVWTWGIGHTASAGDPDPAEMQRGMPADFDREMREVIATFRRDLARFEARVNDAVKVTLAQHEFDALVSFDFNTGGIYGARLTELLNRGEYILAGEAFLGWSKPKEIIPRREAERKLFLTGEYHTGAIAVWSAGMDGRRGKIVRTMPQAEFMARMAGDAPEPTPAPAPVQAAPGGLAGLLAAILAFLARIFGGAR
jgi:lysozyme